MVGILSYDSILCSGPILSSKRDHVPNINHNLYSRLSTYILYIHTNIEP